MLAGLAMLPETVAIAKVVVFATPVMVTDLKAVVTLAGLLAGS